MKTKTSLASIRAMARARYHAADAVVRLLVRCLLCALAFPLACFVAEVRADGPALAPANPWPFVSIGVNVVLGVLGFLFARWIGQQIRVAVLELELRFQAHYASKDDVEALEKRVEDKIALAKKIDDGFARTHSLLAVRGGRRSAGDAPEALVR
ncbi:MAG: hypothetical protein ACXW5J_26755 [Thermoanaerobaculia bacterium]